MPSTARVTPRGRKKWVLRSRTESSKRGICAASAVGVGGIAQPVAEEVEGKDREDHKGTRIHEPGGTRHRADVLRLAQQHAPRDDGRLEPEAEEAQGGFREDHAG